MKLFLKLLIFWENHSSKCQNFEIALWKPKSYRPLSLKSNLFGLFHYISSSFGEGGMLWVQMVGGYHCVLILKNWHKISLKTCFTKNDSLKRSHLSLTRSLHVTYRNTWTFKVYKNELKGTNKSQQTSKQMQTWIKKHNIWVLGIWMKTD